MSGMQYDKATLMRSQERRQKMLDLLHATPGLDASGLIAALPEYTLESVRGAIANMLAKSEIAATGPKRDRKYFALVTTTHSAASVLEAKYARNRVGNAKRDPETVNQARERKRATEAKRAQRQREREAAAQPWRTVHIVRPDDPPIKNQGGQGAVRSRVFVNCHTEY
jgi:hypothetical protein